MTLTDAGHLTCGGSPHWDIAQGHGARRPVELTPVLQRQRQQEVWKDGKAERDNTVNNTTGKQKSLLNVYVTQQRNGVHLTY